VQVRVQVRGPVEPQELELELEPVLVQEWPTR
jgi:hypothetical protein